MKTKKLEVILEVFEDDTTTTYKSKFTNQEIITKLMKIINKYHAKELYEFMFEN